MHEHFLVCWLTGLSQLFFGTLVSSPGYHHHLKQGLEFTQKNGVNKDGD